MSAGATSTTITNPLWVIKTRFMVTLSPRTKKQNEIYGHGRHSYDSSPNDSLSPLSHRPRMNIPRTDTRILLTHSPQFTAWKDFVDSTKDSDHH